MFSYTVIVGCKVKCGGAERPFTKPYREGRSLVTDCYVNIKGVAGQCTGDLVLGSEIRPSRTSGVKSI